MDISNNQGDFLTHDMYYWMIAQIQLISISIASHSYVFFLCVCVGAGRGGKRTRKVSSSVYKVRAHHTVSFTMTPKVYISSSGTKYWCHSPLPLPQSLLTTVLLSAPASSASQDSTGKWDHTFLGCAWFISLGPMPSTFIYAGTSSKRSSGPIHPRTDAPAASIRWLLWIIPPWTLKGRSSLGGMISFLVDVFFGKCSGWLDSGIRTAFIFLGETFYCFHNVCTNRHISLSFFFYLLSFDNNRSSNA